MFKEKWVRKESTAKDQWIIRPKKGWNIFHSISGSAGL